MEIMNVEEAAGYVRLSPHTLNRFRVTGGGPRYAKLGGAVRYRREDLDAWIAGQMVRSTSEASAAA